MQETSIEPNTICPFSMGNPNGFKKCNPGCKLFRQNRNGYECYFQELQSISWNTNRNKNNQNFNNQQPPPYGNHY